MRKEEKEQELLFEQLYQTQQELFNARSVKRVKFLQRKLKYLQQMIKSMS
jgi:hypothetical protein